MAQNNHKKKAPPQEKLLAYAKEESEYFYQVLRRIFWLLNCPKKLYSFPLVFSNLIEILELSRVAANIHFSDYNMDNWLEVLPWIFDNLPRWKNEFEDEAILPPSKRQRDKMEGLVPNGLYAMICCSHENAEYHVDYRLLQGHCVIAHVLHFSDLLSQSEYEKFAKIEGKQHEIIYKTTLGIRQLSYSENLPILKLFSYRQSFEKFRASRIKAKLSVFRDEPPAKNFSYFENLLKATKPIPYSYRILGRATSHQNKSKSTWIGHGYINNDNFEIIILEHDDIDDPNYDWGSLHIIPERIPTIPSEENLEELEADTHPSELAGGGELVASKFSKKGAVSYYSAKGQHRHRQMSNQMFPWQYQNLTLPEVSALIQKIELTYKELSQKAIWESFDYQLIEITIMLSTMLWLGASFEKVYQMELYNSRNPSDSDLAINSDHKNGVWQIKITNPPHFIKDEMDPDLIRLPQEYIFLPDLFNIREKIFELLKRSNIREIPNKEVFFNFDSLKFYTNYYLSELGNKRITLAKIENFIFSKIYEHTQNVVIASYITAKQHNLSSVQSFYFTPCLSFLWDTYSAVSKKLYKEISADMDLTEAAPAIDLSDRYVGAKYCSKPLTVMRGIKKLKEDIYTMGKNQKIIELHNLYTLYTILMFGYSTALRAVRSPLIHHSQIDETYSLVVIADKEDRYGSKSRPVSIPPLLQIQLNNYDKHCHLAAEIMNLNNTHWQQNNCFFLSEDGAPVEVRPKQVTELLQPYIPVRANAHRRFIYTYLTEHNCPAEVVNAWMGHAANGLESWGKYSSFEYSEYVQELQKYLFPMLTKLGWKPLESPLLNYE